MSDKLKKGIIIGIILFISIVSILFVLFLSDEKYNYSNIQEISDSGITLVYTGEDTKTKICFVKYYEENELAELMAKLKKNDVIYIPKNTSIDKAFFDSLSKFDYKVKFPNNEIKIEIQGNDTKNKEEVKKR